VASIPVKCDQFDILAAFEAGGTGAEGVRISITDLPDSTDLIVTIDRSFLNSAAAKEYSIDYLARNRKWVTARAVVELDQAEWEAKLDERRRCEDRRETTCGFDNALTVAFVVPENQSDKRFGLRNVNLTGRGRRLRWAADC
jgi:hypothetical protein